jgi:hypothetical protein
MENNIKNQIILILVIGFTIWLRGYIVPPPIDYSKIAPEHRALVHFAESGGL